MEKVPTPTEELTEEIFVLMPDFDREGYGQPYGDSYYTSLEHAEMVKKSIDNLHYTYEIISLTKALQF